MTDPSPFLTWSAAHRAWARFPCRDTAAAAAAAYNNYLRSLPPDAQCWLAPYLAQLETKE